MANADSVLVVGDALVDEWMEGTSSRLSRDAPVPVVDIQATALTAGGAAAVALHAAGQGADVKMIGVVGDDDDGRRLEATLDERGIDATGVVRVPDRRTVRKTRILVAGQVIARLDDGERSPVPTSAEISMVASLSQAASTASAVIVSDYNLGSVSAALHQRLAELRPTIAFLAVDSHDLVSAADYSPSLATPSWDELIEHKMVPPESGVDRIAAVVGRQETLLRQLGAEVLAVTLDRDGVVVLRAGLKPEVVKPQRIRHGCCAGAGDALVAAMTVGLARGASVRSAAEAGTLAAGRALDGTRNVMARYGNSLGPQAPEAGVIDIAEAAKLAEQARQASQRVVFTNGCFDMLHPGHVGFLAEARVLGDVLIVGLNSDSSVRARKGTDRPVIPERDRASMLAALGSVDSVVIFDGPDAKGLIAAIRPDVYVKGGDYRGQEFPPEIQAVEEIGGEFRILSYVPQYSTTGIVSRLRRGAEGDEG